MKLITKDTNYAVVDEVLPAEAFKEFWKHFNQLDFAYRSMAGWQKVWRLNDGIVLSGPSFFHSQAPFNSPLDWVHTSIVALATQHFSSVVGKQDEDWKDIQFTPYIYPANTKISWHDDGGGHNGACIFYPHQEWGCHWGGELMIAKTPADVQVTDCDMMTRSYVDPILNHFGFGVYVNPLPNRAVFTGGKVWHSINRVDQAAGDHVRCSIVAFFQKEKCGS